MSRFDSPEALVLLVLLPLVLWLVFSRRRRGAARVSSAVLTHGLPRSARQRVSWLPGVLRVAAIVLLIGAVARPQAGLGEVRTTDGALVLFNERRAIPYIPRPAGIVGNTLVGDAEP